MKMNNLTAWERIEIIRHKARPNARDYISLIFDDFTEMHRCYGDDKAILGGVGLLEGIPVTVIAQLKGKNLEENKETNFAMPHPEGYRKALRLMKQAEKFGRPVICLIDTPGAFCGIGAEERGQGEAIAKNLFELSVLKTPVISVVLGEGGSGGALALGVCDTLAMMENAVYSVISPRGFASILWKDSSREKDAANILRITAEDLVKLKIADAIIKEPKGGAQNSIIVTSAHLKKFLCEEVKKNINKPIDNLIKNRYDKFRRIGEFAE
ncbi:MAG: acetyl-CoA carboxylase carboxyltransferase subunit alpha [Oscillospiraceae bacterium]